MSTVVPPSGRRDATIRALVAASADAGAWRIVGDDAVAVIDVTHDSRAVTSGTLFCCVRGTRHDGHDFAGAAVDAGASALVVDHVLDLAVTQVVVPDVRRAMAPLAAAVAGHPSTRLTVVGVTGTNGKTTTVSLLADVFRHAGRVTETIGTLSGTFTTPESPDLQRRLAEYEAVGVDTVAMEVSSHALVQHRVDAMEFAAAVFTNLGHDHLDLHGSQEAYFEAKASLFEPDRTRLAVVNTGDDWGRRLAERLRARGQAVHDFDVATLTDVQVSADRHSYRWRGHRVEVPLGARFNVANSLGAATTAHALGVDDKTIVEALATARPVPGRFESVAERHPFSVVVDFAHTPDGLHAVIAAARDAAGTGRVIVVFGCGGDRDRDKRPAMGRVVATEADLAVVTSDNPRTEDPLSIIDDVLKGVPDEYRSNALVEPDRRTAMGVAFRVARPGDVVVIAGKGHETTQTIGTTAVAFDDREVARQVLESLP